MQCNAIIIKGCILNLFLLLIMLNKVQVLEKSKKELKFETDLIHMQMLTI